MTTEQISTYTDLKIEAEIHIDTAFANKRIKHYASLEPLDEKASRRKQKLESFIRRHTEGRLTKPTCRANPLIRRYGESQRWAMVNPNIQVLPAGDRGIIKAPPGSVLLSLRFPRLEIYTSLKASGEKWLPDPDAVTAEIIRGLIGLANEEITKQAFFAYLYRRSESSGLAWVREQGKLVSEYEWAETTRRIRQSLPRLTEWLEVEADPRDTARKVQREAADALGLFIAPLCLLADTKVSIITSDEIVVLCKRNRVKQIAAAMKKIADKNEIIMRTATISRWTSW